MYIELYVYSIGYNRFSSLFQKIHLHKSIKNDPLPSCFLRDFNEKFGDIGVYNRKIKTVHRNISRER